MDDERKRKKFTLYLHPEKAADFQTLEAIESVPRSERGELFGMHLFLEWRYTNLILACLYC